MTATVIACGCGDVEVELRGAPILTTVCYCDDCQAGGQALQALPDAKPARDPDGGTPYALYRKDRVVVLRGADKLEPMKLRPDSPTNRMVARCCNTPMFVGFDRGPFWVSVYRHRFGAGAPALQSRVQTKFAPAGTVFPTDVPVHASYPLGFIVRIAGAGIAMAFPQRRGHAP